MAAAHRFKAWIPGTQFPSTGWDGQVEDHWPSAACQAVRLLARLPAQVDHVNRWIIRRYNNQQGNNHKVACSLYHRPDERHAGNKSWRHLSIRRNNRYRCLSECEHDIGGGDNAEPSRYLDGWIAVWRYENKRKWTLKLVLERFTAINNLLVFRGDSETEN